MPGPPDGFVTVVGQDAGRRVLLAQLGDDGFAAVMTTALRVMKRVGWR